MTDADIRFYFDPVCPFAWMTSKWVRMVAAQRDYAVDWRFLSLRLINANVDYDSHFPAGYEEGHASGLRLLRLARAGLPAGLADALGDARWDEEIRAEGEEALSLTGQDVGTPIIHFGPGGRRFSAR